MSDQELMTFSQYASQYHKKQRRGQSWKESQHEASIEWHAYKDSQRGQQSEETLDAPCVADFEERVPGTNSCVRRIVPKGDFAKKRDKLLKQRAEQAVQIHRVRQTFKSLLADYAAERERAEELAVQHSALLKKFKLEKSAHAKQLSKEREQWKNHDVRISKTGGWSLAAVKHQLSASKAINKRLLEHVHLMESRMDQERADSAVRLARANRAVQVAEEAHVNEAAEDAAEALARELELSRAHEANLERRLSEAEVRVKNAQQSPASFAHGTNASLRDEVRALEAALAQQSKLTVEFEEQLREAKEHVNDHARKIADLRAQLAKAQAKDAAQKVGSPAKIARMRSDLDSAKQLIEERQVELQATRDELGAVHEKYKRAKAALAVHTSSASQTNEQWAAQIATKEHTISELEAQLEERSNEIEDLQAKLAKQQAVAAAAVKDDKDDDAAIAQLRAQSARQLSDYQQLESKLSAMRLELVAAREAAKIRVHGDESAHERAMQALEDEARVLKQTRYDLEAQVRELSDDATAAQRRQAEMQQQIDELKLVANQSGDEMQDQIASLQSRLSAAQKEAGEAHRDRLAWVSTEGDLRAQLESSRVAEQSMRAELKAAGTRAREELKIAVQSQAQLTKQLEQAIEQERVAKSASVSSQAQLETVRAELDALRQREKLKYEELSRRFEEAKKQVANGAEIERKLTEANATIADMRQKSALAKELADKDHRAVGELKDSLARLEQSKANELAALDRKLNVALSDDKRDHSAIAEMQIKLDAKRDELNRIISAHEAAIKASKSELEARSAELAKTNEKLRKSNDEIAKLQGAAAENKVRMDQLMAKYAASEKAAKEAGEALTEARTSASEQAKQYAALQDSDVRTKKALEVAKAQLDASEKNLAACKAAKAAGANIEAARQLERKDAELVKTTEELSRAKSDLERSVSKLERMKLEAETQRKQLEAVERQMTQLRSQMASSPAAAAAPSVVAQLFNLGKSAVGMGAAAEQSAAKVEAAVDELEDDGSAAAVANEVFTDFKTFVTKATKKASKNAAQQDSSAAEFAQQFPGALFDSFPGNFSNAGLRKRSIDAVAGAKTVKKTDKAADRAAIAKALMEKYEELREDR